MNISYALDLHVHSKYARATSKSLEIPVMAEWGEYKGMDVVGTGDCFHPAWLDHLQQHLHEDVSGLLSVTNSSTKFLLTVETSHIYKDKGKVRRVHIVTLFPNLAAVQKVQAELVQRKVNIASDGRPIMGLSCHDYCELVWSVAPDAFIIPAHIWTPWFSLFGAFSGYDSLDDAFGEFTPRITAIETGLSSDPAMNWELSQLHDKVIVSFSDAHSPAKLGREYTLYLGELTYKGIVDAFRHPGTERRGVIGSKDRDAIGPLGLQHDGLNQVLATVEFFPEEGKYHYDGHRACGIRVTSKETKEHAGICPVCGKKITTGVLHRVMQLSDQETLSTESQDKQGVLWVAQEGRVPYARLVPLEEILAEVLGVRVMAKKVRTLYLQLVQKYGSERAILLEVNMDDLKKDGFIEIAEAIDDVRKGDIEIEPGYDGQFGVIRLKKSSA